MNIYTVDLRELMSFEEVAVLAGGSRRQVEEAIKRGDLVRVSLGNRCVRITRASAEKWAKTRAAKRIEATR